MPAEHPDPAPATGARVRPVHTRVPGRARIEVAGLRRDPARCRRLERRLEQWAIVRAVRANPLTGRILVHFDPDQPLDAVTAAVGWVAGELGLPGGAGPEPWHPGPADPSGASGGEGEVPVAEPWHGRTLAEVREALGPGSAEGLDHAEAMARLTRFGPNRLEAVRQRSHLAILGEQFTTLPVAMLGASAVISLATGGIVDAVVILGVVLINAAIGFVTERQAERTIRGLGRVPPRPVRLRREGVVQEIPAAEVVPGDLVLLAPGTHVPADMRLLESKRLSVDESPLTGESLPSEKTADAVLDAETPLAERRNMVYMGTVVTGGSGLGLVTGTGADTEIGAIQSLVAGARPPETPMQRQLEGLGTRLGVLSGAVCAGVFVIGLLRGQGLFAMLKSSVSLAVAAVPEGLPAVATTTLALGIQNMRKHRVAIRRLDAVETLGSVQVFCMDKTGTLTLNRMTAVAIHTDARLRVADGEIRSGDRPVEVAGAPAVQGLLEVVSLCSETELEGPEDAPVLAGSPTENAMVRLALEAGIDVRALRRDRPRRKVVYRAEGRPYMRTVHELPDGGLLAAVKGSPAEVLEMCATELVDGEIRELDASRRDAILQENEAMAGDALRVLGAARGVVTGVEDSGRGQLTWLGMVGMADPLRTGMADLVAVYHRAGVDTVMITGDQSSTAYSIGSQLGLSRDRALRIMDSTHLEKVEPELLAGLVRDVHVFSRVSPAHKLEIVRAFQESGRVVAMTGDGVNDGPALKAADIGVAMGQGGTDVAREMADVVLEDDNLQTMTVAIRQGRAIYDNIRKTIHFLLSTNFSEIELMAASLALGLGQPLNPMQLLWINLITDIFPGLALSMEPAEPAIMEREPRDLDEPIIRGRDLGRMGLESVWITGGALATYVYALRRYGPGPRATTHAFTTITLAQLLHAVSCRSTRHSVFSRERLPANRALRWALGGSLAVQGAAIAVPPLRRLLGNTPLGPVDLGVVAAGTLLPFVVNEAGKHVRSRRGGTLPALAQPEKETQG